MLAPHSTSTIPLVPVNKVRQFVAAFSYAVVLISINYVKLARRYVPTRRLPIAGWWRHLVSRLNHRQRCSKRPRTANLAF